VSLAANEINGDVSNGTSARVVHIYITIGAGILRFMMSEFKPRPHEVNGYRIQGKLIMNGLRPHRHWVLGFESHLRGMDVCVRLFCDRAVLCAGIALAMG
jgi:hypothetical protein